MKVMHEVLLVLLFTLQWWRHVTFTWYSPCGSGNQKGQDETFRQMEVKIHDATIINGMFGGSNQFGLSFLSQFKNCETRKNIGKHSSLQMSVLQKDLG